MKKDDELDWLQDFLWFNSNGDWEHCFGIQINSLDNPGWGVTIYISETVLLNLTPISLKHFKSKHDWYTICRKQDKAKEDIIQANCSPQHLRTVLQHIAQWAGPVERTAQHIKWRELEKFLEEEKTD